MYSTVRVLFGVLLVICQMNVIYIYVYNKAGRCASGPGGTKAVPGTVLILIRWRLVYSIAIATEACPDADIIRRQHADVYIL